MKKIILIIAISLGSLFGTTNQTKNINSISDEQLVNYKFNILLQLIFENYTNNRYSTVYEAIRMAKVYVDNTRKNPTNYYEVESIGKLKEDVNKYGCIDGVKLAVIYLGLDGTTRLQFKDSTGYMYSIFPVTENMTSKIESLEGGMPYTIYGKIYTYDKDTTELVFSLYDVR